jgi:hypothetical protein
LAIGHWRVVVGYNDSTKQIIFLDPGKDETYTPIGYDEFNQNWTTMENIFIGSGDMITIQK